MIRNIILPILLGAGLMGCASISDNDPEVKFDPLFGSKKQKETRTKDFESKYEKIVDGDTDRRSPASSLGNRHV